MAKKTFTPEQIISKLREVEVFVGQGETVASGCGRWRKQYGGMGTEQLKRLKELEKENTRLKRVVAGLSLEKSILAEVSEDIDLGETFKPCPST